jgi:hypothetical protein
VKTRYRALVECRRPSPWMVRRQLGDVAVVAGPSSLEDGSGTVQGQRRRLLSMWTKGGSLQSDPAPSRLVV